MVVVDGMPSTTRSVAVQRGWDETDLQGLGTSTSADAKKYFNDLDKHRLAFETIKPDDRALIDMAFSKKKADERKEWLRQFRVSLHIPNLN
jgi:DNA topoisomerase-2